MVPGNRRLQPMMFLPSLSALEAYNSMETAYAGVSLAQTGAPFLYAGPLTNRHST
jgi:hypothetical protein